MFYFSVSETDVDEFALMSDDHNPLHTSREFFAGTPFEVTVPHGALIVHKTLNTLKFSPGRVWVGVLKFELPLILGQEYEIVTESSNGWLQVEIMDGSLRMCLFKFEFSDQSAAKRKLAASELPSNDDHPGLTLRYPGRITTQNHFEAVLQIMSWFVGMVSPGHGAILRDARIKMTQILATERIPPLKTKQQVNFNVNVLKSIDRWGLTRSSLTITDDKQVIAEIETRAVGVQKTVAQARRPVPVRSKLKLTGAALEVGASRGLGRPLCEALAEQGQLVFGFSRSQQRVTPPSKQGNRAIPPPPIHYLSGDAAVTADVSRLCS